MPVKRLPFERKPRNSVAAQNQKGCESGHPRCRPGRRFSKLQRCHTCERLRAMFPSIGSPIPGRLTRQARSPAISRPVQAYTWACSPPRYSD
jgi:hypothetical protein